MRNQLRKKYRFLQGGQTLLEALIALAVFALIVQALAAAAAGGFLGVGQGADQTYAHALLSSGMEAVHSVGDRAWNELAYKQVSVATSSSGWQLTQSNVPEQFDRFQRQIIVHDVCRSSVSAIVACPGAGSDYNDPHTKRVTVAVSWSPRPGVTSIASSTMQMTNWESRDWLQNDWSGGSGQAVWSATNKYNSQDGNLAYGVPSWLQLAPVAAGSWSINTPYSGSITTRQLNAVAFIPGTNRAWAVGNAGTLLYFDGTAWTSVAVPISNPINNIFIVDATHGWAAAAGGNILFWNGTTWSVAIDTGAETWSAIYMLSNTSGWVVGAGGNVRKYNGASVSDWSVVSFPVGTNINTVYGIAENNVWAAGDTGRIFHWDGSAWTVSQDTGSQTWGGMSILSNKEGWLVGTGGNIYRFDGTAWNPYTNTGSDTWQRIYMINPVRGWAVGNTGRIIRWNGSSWISDVSGTNRTLFGVGFSLVGSTINGFAVGTNGTILKYTEVASYKTTANLISSAFSLTDNSPVQVIEWDRVMPPSCSLCSIKFQLETAPDVGGSPGAWTSTWTGPNGIDGNETDFFTINTGERIPTDLNGNRWVRYKITFTGDGIATPVLTGVRINYK